MKRIICCVLLITVLLSTMTPAYAHDAAEHNLHLESVLFGPVNAVNAMSPEAQNALKALEYASYLAIDQYNGNGTTELTFLRSTYHVPGLPTNIDAIDFRGNEYHRKFTHYGWDHQYYDDRANWAVRKDILLATTEKVFDFQTISGKILWHDFGYAQKCNSFAALVYYVHVLGDHEGRKSYKNIAMMQLAQPHPDQSPDIYSELKYHLQILFADQISTHKYKAFMEELDTQAEEARRLAASNGGINSDEKFAVYKGQVDALLTLLQDYVWQMLKEEKFFTDVFS